MLERKGVGAMSLTCTICKTGFMANQSDAQLQTHIDSKHPKSSMAECFPGRA